ncbi:hypothetical protein MNBD_GAMMA01-1407 [hydrothermal vent metagenome]|uniref:Uncharacterized protein n=1 Tax=hydrothermal vent metagenome TaxID=652676 RepID=A0A3B0VPM7_9ZZZZ
MSETLFDIVFKGKYTNNIDRSKATLHFSKLFKLSVAKAEHFFDGKPRTLKKSLDLAKASHFRTALKKAGLRVSLVKQASQQVGSQLTLAELGAIMANKPFVQTQHFNTTQFALDEVGIKLVEFKPIKKLEFDLTSLKIDEVGVQLVEQQQIPRLDIDISELSMDEVGTVFAEQEIIAEPDLDISTLSIDEPGAILVEKETVPKPDINIAGMKLIP